MSDLEARIDRLESLEALRKLKHTYCRYCDDNYDPEGLASLFWEDAVWDAGPDFGRLEGPRAIASFFREVSATIVWARHLVTNERIEVDGDVATGEFQLIQPCTFAEGEERRAAWIIARYKERYARRDGVWKYVELIAEIDFITPYEKGWAVAKSLT